MTSSQFKAAIRARGMNQRDAAKALGVTEAAVSLWINGHRPVPGIAEVALRSIPVLPNKKTKVA